MFKVRGTIVDREEMFEKFLGVNTADEEVVFANKEFSKRNEKGKYYPYEASEYEGLIKIFDEVTLTPQDTLVDIGCGMGRVLFYCNQRFMCNVTGVEYDKEIYDRLQDNAAYYHVRFKNQERKFCLLNMKAEDYVIEPKDNFFYMFNPFSKDILEDFLNKLVASVRHSPRKVTVILYYCTYAMMETMRATPFKLSSIIKLPAYRFDPDEKVYIYEFEQ